MRLKTSCFDKVLLKKNLVRFAPVWAGYLLFLLLVLAVQAGSGSDYYFVDDFTSLFPEMAAFNLVFALIVVQAVFGDLYSPRICYTLHALPVRRFGIYGAGLITGLLCSLIPTAVMALIAAPLLARAPVADAGWLALYWWVCAGGQYLFFFGSGVCCAMLAGNRLGQAGLYAMVNLGGVVAYGLADTAFTPLLYGVLTPSAPYTRFSPAVYIMDIWNFISMKSWEVQIGPDEWTVEGSYTLGQGWDYILVIAVIGGILLIAGWLLYRRRNLEAAGDFLAVKALEPVCLSCLSLTVGTLACDAGRHAVVDLGLPFLAVGMVIGWLAGRMLLERSVRVFRPAAFRGLALLAAAVAIALGMTKIDVLRIDDRIPDASQIETVLIDIIPVEEKNIQTALQLHSHALTDRWDGNEDVPYVVRDLTYQLKNGSTIRRRYSIPVDSEAGSKARLLGSSIPYLFRYQIGKMDDPAFSATWENDFPTAKTLLALSDTPISISVGDQYIPAELLTKESVDLLLNAVIADSEEGNLGPSVFHPSYPMPDGETRAPCGSLEIILPPAGEYTRLNVTVFQDSTHTLEALDKLGITWDSIREYYEAGYSG